MRQRAARHKQSIFREERAQSPPSPSAVEGTSGPREEVGGQRPEDWSASPIAAALLVTMPVPEEADQVLVWQQAFSALAPRGGSTPAGRGATAPGDKASRAPRRSQRPPRPRKPGRPG